MALAGLPVVAVCRRVVQAHAQVADTHPVAHDGAVRLRHAAVGQRVAVVVVEVGAPLADLLADGELAQVPVAQVLGFGAIQHQRLAYGFSVHQQVQQRELPGNHDLLLRLAGRRRHQHRLGHGSRCRPLYLPRRRHRLHPRVLARPAPHHAERQHQQQPRHPRSHRRSVSVSHWSAAATPHPCLLNAQERRAPAARARSALHHPGRGEAAGPPLPGRRQDASRAMRHGDPSRKTLQAGGELRRGSNTARDAAAARPARAHRRKVETGAGDHQPERERGQPTRRSRSGGQSPRVHGVSRSGNSPLRQQPKRRTRHCAGTPGRVSRPRRWLLRRASLI